MTLIEEAMESIAINTNDGEKDEIILYCMTGIHHFDHRSPLDQGWTGVKQQQQIATLCCVELQV